MWYPVPPALMQEMEQLVERLRAGGYDGRDRFIAEAPRHLGTRLTALRQMEALASTMAAGWLDGEMNDREFRELMVVSLLPKVCALANLVEETLQPDDAEPPGDGAQGFLAPWKGLRAIIDWMREAGDDDLPRCGPSAIAFLVATMVVRQFAQWNLHGQTSNPAFVAASSNIAPQFYAQCTAALGQCPLGAEEGVPLSHLVQRLADSPMQCIATAN